MRVYYRNNDVSQEAATLPNSKHVAKQLISLIQDKSKSEADRDRAFRFFYYVPPSQRDRRWVHAVENFLKSVK